MLPHHNLTGGMKTLVEHIRLLRLRGHTVVAVHRHAPLDATLAEAGRASSWRYIAAAHLGKASTDATLVDFVSSTHTAAHDSTAGMHAQGICILHGRGRSRLVVALHR